MADDNSAMPSRRRWAELRFSIIGPLLARPPEHGELHAELTKLAAQSYRHSPDGRPLQFGVSTIERWYYKALAAKDGSAMAALTRRTRKDRGLQPSINAQLRQALLVQYREHSSWSYKLHADNLAALAKLSPELGTAPSYATVVRFLKRHGLLRQRRRPGGKRPGALAARAHHERREVRSWEVAHVGGLWHLDFHHGSRSVVSSDGRWRKPYLLGVLDDHSRLCCHLQWYLAETAENLIHALSQALMKRGLPRALMTDNGAAMLADEVRQGLSRLSIVHETTAPYTPEHNAKQEILWAQVEGRLMAMLEGVGELTLGSLNEVTVAWMEADYNRKVHSEIAARPVDRFVQSPSVLRASPSADELRLAFTAETTRAVRHTDGTISLCGVRFELPWQYRHLTRVSVRFASWDLAYVCLADAHNDTVITRLYPLDKTRNADGRRRVVAAVPASITDSGGQLSLPTEPRRNAKATMAPLLEQILADYSATGLPPAYLPKDEIVEIEQPHKKENPPEASQ
jgi:transposase InsO family protein